MEFRSYASGSSGNLYVVRSGGSSLLIEAGISLAKIMKELNYKTSECSGVLISHCHKDHSEAVFDLARLGIDCYMTRETAKELKLDDEGFLHRLKLIEPMTAVDIDGFKVLSFETVHDCPGSVGFLVSDGKDKLLYASDTYYIKNKFRGLTIIAIECNWSNDTWADGIDESLKRRIMTTHLSLEVVKEFLTVTDLSKVREIWLLHMSNSNSNAEMFKSEIQKLTGKPVYVA